MFLKPDISEGFLLSQETIIYVCFNTYIYFCLGLNKTLKKGEVVKEEDEDAEKQKVGVTLKKY